MPGLQGILTCRTASAVQDSPTSMAARISGPSTVLLRGVGKMVTELSLGYLEKAGTNKVSSVPNMFI